MIFGIQLQCNPIALENANKKANHEWYVVQAHNAEYSCYVTYNLISCIYIRTTRQLNEMLQEGMLSVVFLVSSLHIVIAGRVNQRLPWDVKVFLKVNIDE